MLVLIWYATVAVGLVLAVQLARRVVRDGIYVHPRRLGRVLAATLLGTLVGVSIHFGYQHERLLGKQAFMEYQSHRFDRIFATPYPVFSLIVAMVVFVCAAAGVYELVAWILFRMIRSAVKHDAA